MKVQDASNVIATQPFIRHVATDSSVSEPVPILPSTVYEVAQPSPEMLKAYVDKVNQSLKQKHVNLDFSIDKNSHVPIVKVTDSLTGEVVMQFPSKAVLAISEALSNNQKGALLKDQV